ncbi:hypothetical protein AVEN_228862-1 [Araneus ventricosus]|uniref:Uncharacterized protein n=1 Tax=Araneus ventricosus TaxID=182803 RepID=A0A4Y2KXC6_ARAVE|nr:hypothetical protein AVEN_228862-1 [Araneus ventricosus]
MLMASFEDCSEFAFGLPLTVLGNIPFPQGENFTERVGRSRTIGKFGVTLAFRAGNLLIPTSLPIYTTCIEANTFCYQISSAALAFCRLDHLLSISPSPKSNLVSA